MFARIVFAQRSAAPVPTASNRYKRTSKSKNLGKKRKKSGKVAKKRTAPPPGVNMYKTTVQGADQSVQRASQAEEARPVAGDLWSF